MFLVGRWLRRRNSHQQDSGEAWSPACSGDHRPFPTFSTSLLGPALETVPSHTNRLLPLRALSKPILGPRTREMARNVFTPRARRVTYPPHGCAAPRDREQGRSRTASGREDWQVHYTKATHPRAPKSHSRRPRVPQAHAQDVHSSTCAEETVHGPSAAERTQLWAVPP